MTLWIREKQEMNERTGKENSHGSPCFRVWLCGAFRVERRVGSSYSGIRTAEWGGSSYPRLLLKALLRCSGRQARREALLELLWPESDPEQAAQYFNTATTKLRKVLSPAKGQASLLMTEDDSQLYRLAGQERLWVDVDAALTLLQEVERLGRTSWEALALLEEADSYLSQGPLLQDEEGLWAVGRRATVEQARSRCRLWLAEAYAQQQMPGQAATALSQLLEEDPTDEDVLARVMGLLHRQGMTHQALRSYHAFLEVAEREGLEPTEAIKKLATQLATSQKSAPLDAFPSSFSPMEGQNRAFSPQRRQTETHVVEATSSPLSDDQEFLPLTEKPSEHAGPLLAETRHLLGRQEWLASVLAQIQVEIPKKLLVLHGPIGVGKSSELNRLAHAFVKHNTSPAQVIVLSLPAREPRDPEASLDLFVGMLLSESRAAPFPDDASRQIRIKLALTALAQQPQLTVILLDNAEGTLTEEGTLSPCWEAFLSSAVRGQHQATFVLATKEWPGWPGRDSQLVAEIAVPALTLEDSVLLLQRLGLESVPLAALETISQRVACIPLCLEWIATIAHDPLVHDEWEGFEVQEETSSQSRLDAISQRLTRLLEHPTLLGEHLASRLTPLLEHILDRHLSADAQRVLEHLAVVSIPLGKPALHVFCSRPSWLKELRSASLLAAYTNRIQILPTVASTVRARLSPEQVYELEERMIEALTRWVDNNSINVHEAGGVIAELASLQLRHHCLLEAAELLLYHGWLGFQQGYAFPLARLTEQILNEFDWRATKKAESGGLLLHYFLMSHIGLKWDERERVSDHQRILDYVLSGQVRVEPLMEVYIIHILLFSLMNEDHFEEAQQLLDRCFHRMEPLLETDFELHAMLLSKSGWLYGKWGEHAEMQDHREETQHLIEQAIGFYRKCICVLRENEQVVDLNPLRKSTLRKKLAVFLNNLSYHLNRRGKCEEALEIIEQCITLQEQGYADFGALAAPYGEKSQILAKLGRFQEALYFDEKARREIQRCADTGDTWLQKEVRVYQVNQGRLYLRLGRIDEAEDLLRKALPQILASRKIYRKLAQETLMEIEQIRRSSHPRQLDWRWIDRYRKLDGYDAYWWWTPAGPFTDEERHQWNAVFTTHLDEKRKSQLGTLLTQTRNREIEAALAKHREPQFFYPALDSLEVRQRIAGLLQLDADIQRDEPNALVRRLYHGAIEDELTFLQTIEATYEGDSDRFWELNKKLNPLPTADEMAFALSRVKQIVLLGLHRDNTREISEHVTHLLQEQFHLTLDCAQEKEQVQPLWIDGAPSAPLQEHILPAQAAKRFFEAVFQEAGLQNWQVAIDPGPGGVRVDAALKVLFLQNTPLSLESIKETFFHEILGHVSRSVAGEHSLLGLLGLNTKNYSPTEEGLTQYYEQTLSELQGQTFDDSGTWMGGLVVGLASGVMTPPQTFSSLYIFLVPFILLYRLLWQYDENAVIAEKNAHDRAITRCLRTFRGVPDLRRTGICNTRDVTYLRGRLQIEQALAQDATVLDRLAVGKIALELLPDLQELGIVSTPFHKLRKRAYDPDLGTYILSFHTPEMS